MIIKIIKIINPTGAGGPKSAGFAAVKLLKIIVRAPTKSAVPSDRDTKPLANSVTERFAIVGEVAHISA
jgi:hypothetical protein